ncbi:DNA polymerase IV [Streptoalloteichus hindustanus]|uniref:DNA polymerase IV n=1 Tax=Streptoalloteichus hindustanus TaxID=2017 RepID=A0A1M5AVN9_STRHI|nr:DNA polymerase-4 [Streptoalloteichus hindustanus]
MGRSGDLPKALRPSTNGPDGPPPDDTGCTILHVDMDAFYASVETRGRPELRGRPVVVGGLGPRGVVSSANYAARAFGVRSAMPTARARRLCPHAVYLPPDFRRYQEVSRGVMAIFGEVTPLVEPLSLDEAFLDVAGALRRTGSTPGGIAAGIRARVAAEHGITCSVGVAPTKFVAKLASGMAKPDGLLVVPADRVLDVLHPLPVSALWGVGARTAEQLRRVGLETVADIAHSPLPRLRRTIGAAAAEHLHALANGRDDRQVVPDAAEKSVGAEETFDTDLYDRVVLRRELLRLAERAAAALRARGLRGRTVSIKVRFADFTTITRSRTLPVATDVAREVYAVARDLFDNHVPDGAIRLVGVRMEQLVDAARAVEQLTFDGPERGWRDAEIAADVARTRFGSSAVRPASLLPREGGVGNSAKREGGTG